MIKTPIINHLDSSIRLFFQKKGVMPNAIVLPENLFALLKREAIAKHKCWCCGLPQTIPDLFFEPYKHQYYWDFTRNTYVNVIGFDGDTGIEFQVHLYDFEKQESSQILYFKIDLDNPSSEPILINEYAPRI